MGIVIIIGLVLLAVGLIVNLVFWGVLVAAIGSWTGPR